VAGHQVLTATRDPARLERMGWFDDVTPCHSRRFRHRVVPDVLVQLPCNSD
jgi:hypothetical protein